MTNFINQFLSLLQLYQIEDIIMYEKLLFCLFIYQKEESMIFDFAEHDNGGYIKSPSYIDKFSKFMDDIRSIYKIIQQSSIKSVEHKYSLKVPFNEIYFDWSNYKLILDNIIELK